MSTIVAFNMRKSVFNPSYFCSRTIGVCSSPVYKTLTVESFTDRVLADKPEFLKNNDFHDKLYD
jgi:sphingomyelin phosphodiesterase